MRMWLRDLWWWLRGVRSIDDCMNLCARCKKRGLSHYTLEGCWRYRRPG